MAYTFASANSQYITATSAPASSLPLTLACWFRLSNNTQNHVLLSVTNGTGVDIVMLNAAAGLTGKPLRAQRSAIGTAVADTSVAVTANEWRHAAGTFSGTGASVWLDGANNVSVAGDGSSSVTLSQTTIGARRNSSAFAGLSSAAVAEAAVWNVALSSDEIRSLSLGVSPSLVRPQSLVFYAPLIRAILDMARARSLSANGSPVVSDHPRIYA